MLLPVKGNSQHIRRSLKVKPLKQLLNDLDLGMHFDQLVSRQQEMINTNEADKLTQESDRKLTVFPDKQKEKKIDAGLYLKWKTNTESDRKHTQNLQSPDEWKQLTSQWLIAHQHQVLGVVVLFCKSDNPTYI